MQKKLHDFTESVPLQRFGTEAEISANDGTAAPNLLVEFGDLLADVLALLGAPAMWPGKITPARRIAERLLSRPWYPS
jgi:hypothetical protein